MDTLRNEGVVIRDTLQFLEKIDPKSGLEQVNLRGRVVTASGGILIVNKWLNVRKESHIEVLSSLYRYQALLRRPRTRPEQIFRYDNCHGGVETLHRHCFEAGIETGIVGVAHEELPPLSDIIREAEAEAVAATGR